jgi:hypothetical protein
VEKKGGSHGRAKEDPTRAPHLPPPQSNRAPKKRNKPKREKRTNPFFFLPFPSRRRAFRALPTNSVRSRESTKTRLSVSLSATTFTTLAALWYRNGSRSAQRHSGEGARARARRRYFFSSPRGSTGNEKQKNREGRGGGVGGSNKPKRTGDQDNKREGLLVGGKGVVCDLKRQGKEGKGVILFFFRGKPSSLKKTSSSKHQSRRRQDGRAQRPARP